MDIFQDYQNIASIIQVIGDLTAALVCGLLVSLLYHWTHRRPNYSITFVNSLPALSMITAVIIMVIGNNLARAFGLVGALSIIRFRMAVKDIRDIVFIFFSLAAGMAAGVGLHLIAITGTIFIGVSIFILSQMNHAHLRGREFLLRFSFTLSEEQELPYLPTLEEYCKRHRLINAKSLKKKDMLELSYYTNLKDRGKSGEFVRELGRIQGVTRVNLST